MVAILVVLTVLLCIGVDVAIQYSRARRLPGKAAPVLNPLAGFELKGISLPEGLFVDPAHTWVAVGTSGRTRIGLDAFLTKAIGRIDEIVMPEPGTQVRRGETLFTVRQGERTIAIPAPVAGTVSAINAQVAGNPGLAQISPYEQGWICSVTPRRLALNLKQLSIAEDAVAWIKDEVRRFQEFITSRPVEHVALGTVMQDGGIPAEGVLEFMDNETWNLFSFEFVRSHAAHD